MAMRSRTTGTTNTSRQRGVVQPVYEDFKPMSEWIQDQDADILLIYLPGFMKENIKVSAEGKNIIRVRGERSVSGNKWHRLFEDYKVPDYCNVRGTRARFEGGILTITVPKKTIMPPSDLKHDHVSKPTQEQASSIPQKPKEEDPKTPLTSPQKATPNEKVEAKSAQETPAGSVATRAEATPQDNSKALAEETTPGGVASQAKPSPQDNSKALAEAKSAQETPSSSAARKAEPAPQVNSKALAKSESTQENAQSSAASQAEPTPHCNSAEKTTQCGVANHAEPTPEINYEALPPRDRLSKPKSQEDRDNAGDERSTTRSMDSERGLKQDDTTEGSETESVTTDKSEMPENGTESAERTNDEKNNGSLIPDKAANVAKKVADGVGLAHGVKNKKEEPKANESRTNQFRLEKYKQSVKGLMELDAEKQLLLNVGVAMLVIVALGTYAFYRSRK